jgi:predicted RNA-binding Zn-ribbon protein involved in translation (DUF1610 family)
MQVFISHNKEDAETARLFATALIERGVGVWFDEWALRPGDSIPEGIERGLGDANIFVLFWSARAAASRWVGTEVRAYIRRRVDDGTLRIVPMMLDETRLPVLVAEYRGFRIEKDADRVPAAAEITGVNTDRELVRRLQERLLELTVDVTSGDPLPYFVCPKCGSDQLERSTHRDYRGDEYYCVGCKECSWGDAAEV